jgi:hypothetical protein
MPKMGAIIASTPARLERIKRELAHVPESIGGQVRTTRFGFVEDESVRAALASNDWQGQAVANLPQAKQAEARAILVNFLRPAAPIDTRSAATTTADALQKNGIRELSVEQLGPQKAANRARSALLSYLPKEDVDSQAILERFIAPKTSAEKAARQRAPYVFHLSRNAEGQPEYSSGFLMQNTQLEIDGRPATVLQVDFCSLLEKGSAKTEVGKLELERLIQNGKDAAAKSGKGGPDFVFVEASGIMLDRYADLGFKPLALPGKKGDGDAYVMMALPLTDGAWKAVTPTREFPAQTRPLWNGHVAAWLDTNWQDKNGKPNWRNNERAMAAFAEMTHPHAGGPIWNQVLPG